MRMKTTDTRNGMPMSLNAGPNYLKFKVGRQLHRQLARMVLKDKRSKAKVEARREAHLAMLSRRRQRRAVA